MAKNIGETIDEWFQTLIRGTVVQREIDLYNKFHAGKEELKSLLAPASVKKTVKEEIN